jgi:DNA repair protein RecN (Recombination protein N)
VEELRDVAVRLGELGSDLHRFVATIDAGPDELESVEERLQAIADLKRRYAAASYAELLELATAAAREVADVASGADPVEAARRAAEHAEAHVNEIAAELRAGRGSNAEPLARAVAEELASLGMGEGEFLVELRERDVGSTGADEATFLIRPNPGLPFALIADTASGGELSRISLALAAVAGGETLVFDEIDAGIGGVTAHAVAATLQRLSERAQVLTITHLPQIASVADNHFRVEKVPGDPTHTRIEELGPDDRRDELERMLGGREFLATVAEEDRG